MPLWIYATVHWLINALSLIVVDWAFSGVSIGRWGPLLLAAGLLALANTFVKPVLALLTLPLILVTFGISYFLLNVLMLWFVEWVTPDFTVTGFWTYVGAVIVIWVVNAVVAALLRVNRTQVRARSQSS